MPAFSSFQNQWSFGHGGEWEIAEIHESNYSFSLRRWVGPVKTNPRFYFSCLVWNRTRNIADPGVQSKCENYSHLCKYDIITYKNDSHVCMLLQNMKIIHTICLYDITTYDSHVCMISTPCENYSQLCLSMIIITTYEIFTCK